ncbi:MAG: winged helix DNA-binding protein [Candidatus Lokiarchaeota archaeon]|nr:winged helix DNA-binding protein [Candidatus Lokiarchaeota archaeon]MBD3343169.1 winged helix DNA-binding protein [Candidatus Lokiarchaeota archaeon]
MIDLDYKVIKLLYKSPENLKVGNISSLLDLAHSTIGSCIKRLEEQGLVKYRRYKKVRLTDKGVDLALELIRHAKLLELLLHKELGLSNKEAQAESEKFNLLFSCKTIKKICEKYGHPKKTPQNELIPNARGCYCIEHHK